MFRRDLRLYEHKLTILNNCTPAIIFEMIFNSHTCCAFYVMHKLP